ncbi:MAG: nitrogen fixation protein NifZ [Hydrogenophilales bacterium 28-61-23]|nr:MAG: nitrogen fixation protein NifZ [Hydrogenophilales bacterium 28-61-23]
MEQRFDFGVAVRLTRNVRNDGTFPGLEVGNLLIKRGSVGYVMNVGTFLQDQIIYTVNFLDQGRVVGCRDEELIGADEPWMESRFETREKVRSRLALSIRGEVAVPAGSVGEVFKVLRDLETGVQYHVHFPGGKLLLVPETLLDSPEESHA